CVARNCRRKRRELLALLGRLLTPAGFVLLLISGDGSAEHDCSNYPDCGVKNVGDALTERTPSGLEFRRLRSGFRLRAQKTARRLNFRNACNGRSSLSHCAKTCIA